MRLSCYPQKAQVIFKHLQQAGISVACLYGGALRDTDCSHAQQRIIRINDYDVRAWIPGCNFEEKLVEITDNLSAQKGVKVEDAEWWGLDKPRYKLKLAGVEIDLSLRSKSDALFLDNRIFTRVAVDRAYDSDLGISGIALANNGDTWVSKEYLQDRDNHTITIFPTDHNQRSIAYAERLRNKKFLHHTIIKPV